jgi:hypothetical protein
MRHGAFSHMRLENSNNSTPPSGADNSMAIVRLNEPAPDRGFTPKFNKFFDMAQKYCYAHVNFPSAQKDERLPLHVKDRMMRAATTETAYGIAATGATRYFLMTRIVLDWIIKHVFKPAVFTNFDLEADDRIAALKASIYQGESKLSTSLPTSADLPRHSDNGQIQDPW